MSRGCSVGNKYYKECVCRVRAPPLPPNSVGLQGTAILYELAEGVFTIATNNRVIPNTYNDFLLNIDFIFEGLMLQIRLHDEDIKFCTTNEELDATVIELNDDTVECLQQFGAKFISGYSKKWRENSIAAVPRRRILYRQRSSQSSAIYCRFPSRNFEVHTYTYVESSIVLKRVAASTITFLEDLLNKVQIAH